MSVTVFNVKQGDSFLFNVDKKSSLLIDTGYRKHHIYNKVLGICGDKELSVLITHSHADHIGGLFDVMAKCNVSEIYIPKYMPEIIYIQDLFYRNKVRFGLSSMPGCKIKMLCDGDSFMSLKPGGFYVLNPPVNSADLYPGMNESSYERNTFQSVVDRLNELGLDLDYERLVSYEPSEIFDSNDMESYTEEAREFIANFFISMSDFVFKATKSNVVKLARKQLKTICNRNSIVFKCNDKNDKTWLFTGDADVEAFDRIIKDHGCLSLRADILKVPHHGSRENLNRHIIHAINPELAIISHDNRRLSDIDPHPNTCVVKELRTSSVDVFYTNAVYKKTAPKILYSTLFKQTTKPIPFTFI